MAKITNRTRETLSFIVKGDVKDGVPPTASILAGETKDLDVDMNDATIRGQMLSGVIAIDGEPAAAADKPNAAAAPSGKRTAQTLGGDASVR